MYNVVILWAPDTAENRRVVEAVASAFSDAKLTVNVKKVSDAIVADVTRADIVVFGAQKGAADLPPEFNECIRYFKGITLAGRTAGFFSIGSEKSTARLRKALKDTDISLPEDDPLFADQKPGKSAEVAEWVKRLIQHHQELHHARA
jgi:flavorubredoxin